MKRLILLGASLIFSLTIHAQDLAEHGVDVKKYVPQGLAMKSKAPEISGMSGTGEKFDSRFKLREGPIVITFIRGSWSEESQARVELFTKHASDFAQKGAHVVIISPEKAERVEVLGKDVPSNVYLLADNDGKTMKGFDVLHHVTPIYAKELKERHGVDLEAQDKRGAVLPVMATFVVSKDGLIYARHFELDPTIEPNLDEILHAIPAPSK